MVPHKCINKDVLSLGATLSESLKFRLYTDLDRFCIILNVQPDILIRTENIFIINNSYFTCDRLTAKIVFDILNSQQT